MAEIIEFKPKDTWNQKRDGWEKFDQLARRYGHPRARMLRILAESFYAAVRDHENRVYWPPEINVYPNPRINELE
jgi:hypothetical protein